MSHAVVDKASPDVVARLKASGSENWQALLFLAVGLIFSMQTILGMLPLNIAVVYRTDGIAGTFGAMFAPVLVVGWVVWRIDYTSPQRWLLLGVLAVANFGLQVTGMMADPRGVGLISKIILSPLATSYFNDALQIQDISTWLSHFHQASLTLHAVSHPPGAIVFCWLMIKLFGPVLGSWVCGCALGLAGAAGVLVVYQFAGLWTGDPKSRLLASAIYALTPALVVFFPEFDQGYAVLSMYLMLLWSRTLASVDSGKWQKHAILLGTVIFAASFFAYQILSIGVFLVFCALHWLHQHSFRLAVFPRLLGAAGVAFAVCACIYASLWLATGYNVIASFLHGVAETNRYLVTTTSTPYRVYNFYVFAMGLGGMAVPIFLVHANREFNRFRDNRDCIPFTLIALGSLILIDLTGFFAGETDRDWLFLAPLIAVPVAMELARLTWRWRLVLFAMQGWILVCLKAKISFIEP